jgi:hypothetical protein
MALDKASKQPVDNKKRALLAAGLGLLVLAGGVLWWTTRPPPAPAAEDQQAEAAIQQAYEEVEAKRAEQAPRELQVEPQTGPAENYTPGNRMRAAPK